MVQRCDNLVDLEKCWKISLLSLSETSMQPRTSPVKFARSGPCGSLESPRGRAGLLGADQGAPRGLAAPVHQPRVRAPEPRHRGPLLRHQGWRRPPFSDLAGAIDEATADSFSNFCRCLSTFGRIVLGSIEADFRNQIR